MIGSILLTLALGWLANVDGTDCPCQVAQTTYEVGCCNCPKACSDSACKACCNEACEACGDDCCLTGEMMCGGEPVDMGPVAKSAVVLELRIVETRGDTARKVAYTTFMKPDELRSCLTGIQADPNAVVVSSPTLVLCSGQTGEMKVEGKAPAHAGNCGARCKSDVGGFSFVALPCVSADGRYVSLKLNGNVSVCPDHNSGKTTNWEWRREAVLSDGMSFVMDASPCCSGNMCEMLGQAMHAQLPKNVVVFATVRIADEKGQAVNQPTTCTRDCCSHPTTPACCDDCPACDTVESNLAKLQRAAELYKLAEQYERLNQFDVAGKILANIQEMCPGSRIASEAAELCPQMRMKELMAQSENLRQIQLEWESTWSPDMPRHLNPERVNGGLEESDAPAKCSKLDQVLCSYRKACSEGNKDRARQLAIEALAMDPTCFAK
jgi:hypothetical protein